MNGGRKIAFLFFMLRDKIKHLIKRLPIRLLVAVMVGIVLSKALTMFAHMVMHWFGIFPPLGKPMFNTKLVLIALAYHSVFGVVAAYATAVVARRKARKAVFILGTKEAILWVLGILLLWKHSPAWYNLTKAILGIPLAWLGGQLYIRQREKKEEQQISRQLNERGSIQSSGSGQKGNPQIREMGT